MKMLGLRNSHKMFLSAAVLIAASVAGVVLYEFAVRRQPPPLAPSYAEQSRPEEENRPRLSTISLPGAVRDHLLDGTFQIVRSTEMIELDCRSIFDSSFARGSETLDTQPKSIPLANPGQTFQATDALIQGAPFRRLEFAGVNASSCFIYYQHGGTMYPRFCLVVMDRIQRRAVWVGESPSAVHDLDELRKLLSQGHCWESSGAVC